MRLFIPHWLVWLSGYEKRHFGSSLGPSDGLFNHQLLKNTLQPENEIMKNNINTLLNCAIAIKLPHVPLGVTQVVDAGDIIKGT